MSLEAYVWAANLDLNVCSGTAFRVLLKYADGADKLGYTTWRSITEMADELGCSVRTVQRSIAELLAAGLIRRGDQRHVAHIRGDRRPVVYDVMTTALVYIEARGRTDDTV